MNENLYGEEFAEHRYRLAKSVIRIYGSLFVRQHMERRWKFHLLSMGRINLGRIENLQPGCIHMEQYERQAWCVSRVQSLQPSFIEITGCNKEMLSILQTLALGCPRKV